MDVPDYQFSYFKFSPQYIGFLFEGWNSYKSADMVWMCLASVAMVLALEMIRTAQDYLSLKLKASAQFLARRVETEGEGTSSLLPDVIIPASSRRIKMHRLIIHFAKSILTMVSMFTGYVLMLAVMSYNAWILLTVILSSGLTYLVFNLLRKDLHRRSVLRSKLATIHNQADQPQD